MRRQKGTVATTDSDTLGYHCCRLRAGQAHPHRSLRRRANAEGGEVNVGFMERVLPRCGKGRVAAEIGTRGDCEGTWEGPHSRKAPQYRLSPAGPKGRRPEWVSMH